MDNLQLRLDQDGAYIMLDALTIAASSAIGADDRNAYAAKRDWLQYRITRIWPNARESKPRTNAIIAMGAIHDNLELGASNAGAPPEFAADVLRRDAERNKPELPKRAITERSVPGQSVVRQANGDAT